MNELIVVAFRKTESAQHLLTALCRSEAEDGMEWSALETAIVTRDSVGKFRIRDCVDLIQPQRRRSRAAWRLLVAVIVSGPLGGIIWGATTAGVWGRLLGVGLDEHFMTQIPAALLPGGSALFLLVDEAAVEPACKVLNNGTGRMYRTAALDELDEVLLDALTSG